MPGPEAIEGISPKRKVDYAHLYEMHVEEYEDLEVDEVLYRVNKKESEIQFGRKVAAFNSRLLGQNDQMRNSDEKVSVFRDSKGVFLDGITAVCEISSIVFGALVMGVGRSCEATSKYYEKTIRAQEEVLSTMAQRIRDFVGDLTQKINESQKNVEQSLNAVNQAIQHSRRQTELFAGGG